MLETAVVPRNPSDKARLHTALAELAEQDPFINLRQDDTRQQLLLSLYGEVQKEVIEQTIAAELGIEIEFRETTVICVERVRGTGRAARWLGRNPFLATVGLTLEPGPPGSGVQFRLGAERNTVPLYVYKSFDAFVLAMTEYVRATLRQGLAGWEVVDCIVTMTDSGYSSPGTKASDFRKLTTIVLRAALKRAGTLVCEPVHRFHVDAPADTLPVVLRQLAARRGVPGVPTTTGTRFVLEGAIPAAEVHALQQRIRGLTRGEGVVEVEFDHYSPRRL